jgi:hypothetical protein
LAMPSNSPRCGCFRPRFAAWLRTYDHNEKAPREAGLLFYSVGPAR